MNPDNLISLQKCNVNFFKLKQKGVVSKGKVFINIRALWGLFHQLDN